MLLHQYLSRYDSLHLEESLVEIPGRSQFILSQIGKGKRVLDLGCMGGLLSKKIQQQNNEVRGVEINPTAVDRARARGIRVEQQNVEEGLSFASQEFDVVLAGEILEYVYDTKALLRECRRVLKPRGMLLFSCGNLNSLQNRWAVLMGQEIPELGAYPEDRSGNRVRVLNLKKGEELCRLTGFSVEQVQGLWWSERPLRRKSQASHDLTDPSFLGLEERLNLSMLKLGRLIPQFSKHLLFKAIKR